MSLLKIPVLAQGFKDGTSPYQGKDAEYMTIVIDNSKWHDMIIDIKNDYPHYKKLAEKANYYVKKYYNIKKYCHIWKQEIIKLCQ